MRVMLLVLDGMPWRHVGAHITPNLEALFESGGAARRGALGELPATTYPNHRTFVTGQGWQQHGLRVNDDRHRVDHTAPTILDVCRAAGIGAEIILGDQHLVDVM